MVFVCDVCSKRYTYKRNLKRHIKERNSLREYWRCTEDNSLSKFIRRSYLSKHLVFNHRLSDAEARERALTAPQGDPFSHSYYDDVSDDDSVLDLLSERDNEQINPESFYNVIDKFDCELLHDGLGLNNNSSVRDPNVEIHGTLLPEQANVNLTLRDSCHNSGIEGCVYSDISDAEDHQSSNNNENNNSINGNNELALLNTFAISDDEETAVVPSVLHTVILRISRTLYCVDDNLYSSEFSIEHDFYEY